MDITFQTEKGHFNYRVCGIILHENKILAMHDGRSPYYYLPGGRVKINETAEEAILRELKEEIDIEAKIIRPLWINQGFFIEDVNHEKYHELCVYFLIDITQTNLLLKGNRFVVDENNHCNTFEWLDFNQLKDEYFYPTFLKEKIGNLPKELTLITNFD